MKLRKQYFILVINMFFLLAFLSPFQVDANELTLEESGEEASEEDRRDDGTDTYGNGTYAITKYRVEIDVSEDNIYDIREYIEVYFNEPSLGIYREIPIYNNIERLDGSTGRNKAIISNVLVDDEYSLLELSDSLKIEIGGSYEKITGYKSYAISYTYDMGNDISKDFDELYYNIIGTQWDTTISNVEFSVVMPKDFDESKLGFAVGKYNSSDYSDVYYDIENVDGKKVISGNLDRKLYPGGGLTIRLELPEGYFNQKASNTSTYMTLIAISLLITTFLIWLFLGKDEKIIKTVEFYPPQEYNSAQIGFFYKGKAGEEEITSLLIYLASKGYLEIEEIEEKKLFRKKQSFKIRKLKSYNGNNYYEKKFMQGLFFGRNEVKASELGEKFQDTLREILQRLNHKENIDKIFEKNSLKVDGLISFFIQLTIMFIIVLPLIELERSFDIRSLFINNILTYDSDYLLYQLLTWMFLPFIFLVLIRPCTFLGFVLSFISSYFIVPWIKIILPRLSLDSSYTNVCFLSLACIIGMFILKKFMPKKTAYANEILGKIQGFRTFLKHAEKPKLEALVMENPTYFYDILPYTYVLGLSKKWIEKFEMINMGEPSWYKTSSSTSSGVSPDRVKDRNRTSFNNVSKVAFVGNLTRTMKTASKVITPASSSSSSSGGSSSSSSSRSRSSSSGGGRSGGGSGGGGGGSR